VTTLRELVETARRAHVELARERARVQALTGEERATARAELERIEAARREAETKIERLREWLTSRGFDVTTIRAPTADEAEDAALLDAARAEIERDLDEEAISPPKDSRR
jgi:hypothetical protein